MESLEKIHLVISGRVQGVGFRFHTTEKARELGLVGWVRNREDGGVETVAMGVSARIEAFLTWCHQGPPSSKVSQVHCLERIVIVSPSFSSFDTIR